MKTVARRSGVSTRPVNEAEVPITPCTNSGTNATTPNMHIDESPVAIAQAATSRCLKAENGRIGSTARRSTTANRTSATALAVSRPITWVDPHA